MKDAILSIPVDGRWTIDDLDEFAASFRLSFAYFYALDENAPKDDDKLHHMLSRYFWSGQYAGDFFASRVYYALPREAVPYLRRFEYASPGIIEIGTIAAAIGAFHLLAKCVNAWIKSISDAIELREKIHNFFKERNLEKIQKNFDLSSLSQTDLNVARALCIEYGSVIGLHESHVVRVIDLCGNPIAALKMIVQIARECERLGRLDKGGKARMAQARLSTITKPDEDENDKPQNA